MPERSRVYWLSICDPKKPRDQQFLGVCLIRVTEMDAIRAKVRIDDLFPHHVADAEWIAAATKKARDMGCNPGGEIMSVEIDPTRLPNGALFNVLLSRTELEQAQWI